MLCIYYPESLSGFAFFFFLNKRHVFKFIYLFYLFLAALGLRCCARAFSSCGEQELLFVAVHGLLIAVASLVAEHGLLGTQVSVVVAHGLTSCGLRALECRLSSCGTWALLLRDMWDLPRPGLEPMSPALAGGFLTTVPTGKSQDLFSYLCLPRYRRMTLGRAVLSVRRSNCPASVAVVPS